MSNETDDPRLAGPDAPECPACESPMIRECDVIAGGDGDEQHRDRWACPNCERDG